MLHCKFSGDCNSERIFKIGQYMTKLCVENLGFTFFGPPCMHVVFGHGKVPKHYEGCSYCCCSEILENSLKLCQYATDRN